MITWMQRHKKWLIITIWVSTIAFIGAGFVGWGSYDYGKSNSAVAMIEDREIPLTDLQNEYSALYSQYSQMFGSNFNQEMAKQLKLEEAALQRVIEKHLLLHYADKLGLAVTDKEVAKQLLKIDAFKKDGKFDKNTYMSVLKQNRKTAADFEDQLKKDLLASKLTKIFTTELTKEETKNLNTLLFAEDKVSIKVIEGKDIKVSPTEEQLKKYWEENKNNYKSPKGYKIGYTKIENIEGKTKKEMKKAALKEYLKLKKGEAEFTNTQTIYADSQFFNNENFDKITKSTKGTVLKPIYKDNNYYVVKNIDEVAPQILAYEKVQDQIKEEYILQTKADLLSKKAQNELTNFKGIDIGYIKRGSTHEIDGLSDTQSAEVIQKIFGSKNKQGSINLSDKVVLFNITDTKLAEYDPANDLAVASTIQSLKTNTVLTGLLDQLKNKYTVKSFMGNN